MTTVLHLSACRSLSNYPPTREASDAIFAISSFEVLPVTAV